MLLDILMSSFSNESVYWASWSRLRAQSDRLASSSACTACEGEQEAREVSVSRRLAHDPKSKKKGKKKGKKGGFWHLRELSHLTDTILPGEPEIRDGKKQKTVSDLHQHVLAPLMISISFAVFTPLWGRAWLMNAEWQQCRRRGEAEWEMGRDAEKLQGGRIRQNKQAD